MGKLRVNLTGLKFGKLKVMRYIYRNMRGNANWLCICDCGQQKIVDSSDLKAGNTKSCGCLQIKHGHAIQDHRSQTHVAWSHMKYRCLNSNSSEYPGYGGRSIIVCDRWLVFYNFLADMGEPPTKEHSLDRINNNGNYCLTNCRWATKRQQQGNMRSNHQITFDNKTQCLAAWSREMGINQKTLWRRIVSFNWPIEKAFKTPPKKRRKTGV